MKRTMVHKIDDALYAVERVFVIVSMVLMVLMVFVDVVDRRLQSQESKLAAFLRAFHIPAADAVAPWFGGAVMTALLWFGLATVRRRREAHAEAGAPKGGLAPGLESLLALLGTAILFGLGWVMMHRPSNEFYAVTWALMSVAALASTVRDKQAGWQKRAAGFAAALPIGTAALMFVIPEGFSWAKEIAMILLVWTGLVGASMAAHQGRHIDIDFGKKMFPKRLRVPIAVLANLVTIAFCVLLVALGVIYVFGDVGLYKLGGRFPHTGIPDWTVAVAIPWVFLVIGLRTILIAQRVAAGDLTAKGSSPTAVAPKPGEH